MKLLLTGATGFIGSHLAKSLIKDHHTIVAYHRTPSRFDSLGSFNKDIEWYNLDYKLLCQPFKDWKIDAVIHCATLYDQPCYSDEQILECNVNLPLMLVDLCHKHGAPLFINTDTFFAKPEFNISYQKRYVTSKRHALEKLKKRADAGITKIISLRLEHVYGSNDRPFKFIPWLLKQLLSHTKIEMTACEQRRDFIYIDDVVDAYKCALFLPNCGELQCGTGKSVPVKEVVDLLRKLTHSQSTVDYGALPYKDNEIMDSYSDTSLNQLGWQAHYSLEEGLKDMVSLTNGRLVKV